MMEMVWGALVQISHRLGTFDLILKRVPKVLETGGKDGAGCLSGRRNSIATVQIQADVLLIRDQQVLWYEWEAEFQGDKLRS